MVSHPYPDILEWEVKWALRSTAVNKAIILSFNRFNNKAIIIISSTGDEIPAELFKSLKDDARVLHSGFCIHYVGKSGTPSNGQRIRKGQCSSQSPRRVPKNVLTIGQLHSSPMLVSEVKVTQSCPTLCDSMDYTVHGILQAIILEWIAFPFSRGSSQPRESSQPGIKPSTPALQADSLPAEPQGKPSKVHA